MKKDSMIIMLVVLAVFVVLALVWQSIPAAREVTVDDYATDQHGSSLARWGVYCYEVIGTDTTLVDMDTTDSYGAYEITAPTGSYLIYAFPLWDDSTDTSLSRKSFMNKQTIVAVANDTTFLRFAKADSGFIGNITGSIATAESAGVAHKAHTANDFTVRGKIKEWPTESYGAIPFVIRLDDGKDIHADWGRIAAQEGVPLTYYIITEELGSAGTMTRAEVCSVYGLGHEIGSHTCSGRNLVTLYAAGEYDSCITELSLSQTYLESLLHADADSFAEVRTFVFTGNAANEPLRRWAAKYYDLVSGTSGGIDYTATMESADLYNLRLWDAGSFIDSASVRAASGKTDSAWVADTLSALVAIWKDSSAVSGNYKNYGQRNIGGFYLHGESYTVGGDTLYSGLDTTLFRDMMQTIRTHADAGDLWLVTLAELSDWYRDNLNSIDNRWFTQNQYFSSVYHDADPFSDQVYQTNFRNYYGTQFLYENKYSATGNDSGTACMRVVNAVDGGYGIKYEDYGDGTALYALTGTSPANEGSKDGRAAMVEVRGRPGASALYAYCRDDSTYGVKVHVLPSIDDVPNTHAFYSNRGKHTFGTVLTDSTLMQTATVAGNLTAGGDADISGALTAGGHTQIDSTFTVGVAGTGYDISCYGDSSVACRSRLFWNADKLSFRVGLEDGLDWSDDSTGMYSFAGGYKSKAKGQRAIAWGCDSEANEVASTAFGFSVVNGAYGVGLGWTRVTANYAVAIGKDTEANGISATAIGRKVFANGQRSAGLGNYLKADTTDAIVIGKGVNAFNLLENNIPNSIMLGMNSTTPTVIIKKDTTWIDSVLVCTNIVGNLTGNATTASTCTTWTGAATKVDTNKAAVYRQSDSISDCYVNSTKQWGDASAPSFWEADTVVVSRCFVSANATGTDPWKFVWISCTGDTLAKHTSTTSGYWNWDSTMTATILPTGGIWTKWEEKTTGTDQGRVKQGINYYSVNP